MSDSEWPSQEVNLAVFNAYTDAWHSFCFALMSRVESSRNEPLTLEQISIIKDPNVYGIARFLYMFKAYGINKSERKLRKYYASHIKDMVAQYDLYSAMKDGESRKSQEKRFEQGRGNPKETALESIIWSVMSCLNNDKGRLRFPFKEFARCLTESMVEQTCRTTCAKLDDLGLLTYEVYGKVGREEAFIESDGALENCFKEHLDWLVRSLGAIDGILGT